MATPGNTRPKRTDACICYAEIDTTPALKIAQSLRERGYSVSLMGNYLTDQSKFHEAIANSSVALFCASKALKESKMYKMAAHIAQENQVWALILTITEDETRCQILETLQGFNERVDFTSEGDKYDESIEIVVEFVEEHREKPYDAMICYAKKDTVIGENIAENLRMAKVKGKQLKIYDPRTGNGKELMKISHGIKNSHVVLICVSGSLKDSSLCEKVSAQVHKMKVPVPIKLLKVKNDSSTNEFFSFQDGLPYDFSTDKLFSSSQKKLISDLKKKPKPDEMKAILDALKTMYKGE